MSDPMQQSQVQIPKRVEPVIRLTPPPKRYRIGELAASTGLSRQTLHNYTRWGLIREVAWTRGGHRLYDESAFARLERILALKPTRTVQEIRQILNEEAGADRAA